MVKLHFGNRNMVPMSRSRTWKTCWKTKGTQGEIGGLNKFLLLSPTPNNEYLYLQC